MLIPQRGLPDIYILLLFSLWQFGGLFLKYLYYNTAHFVKWRLFTTSLNFLRIQYAHFGHFRWPIGRSGRSGWCSETLNRSEIGGTTKHFSPTIFKTINHSFNYLYYSYLLGSSFSNELKKIINKKICLPSLIRKHKLRGSVSPCQCESIIFLRSECVFAPTNTGGLFIFFLLIL